MNKKMILMTISLLVIVSMALTACGGTPATAPAPTVPPANVPTTVPPTTAAPVTLTIWHNWGPDDAKGPTTKQIFTDFMAANPDIIIKDEVYVDADIPLKVETASVGNQEPDLVFTGLLGNAYTWADSGVTLPVNDYMTQWGFDGKFLDEAIREYTLANGKIAAFPLEGYSWPVWYNTKVFSTVGVAIPTTTDELIAAAKAIRAAGYQPFITDGEGMGQSLFTLAIQTETTDEEINKCMIQGDWTVPNCIKGVELFVKLRDAGVFVDNVEGITYAGANVQYATGKVAMSHFGAWEMCATEEAAVVRDVQLGGFPLPADSPHKTPIYYVGFQAKGLFITPNGAAKIEAVKKFVQFLYKPENMAKYVEQTAMIAALKDVPVDQSKVNPGCTTPLSGNAQGLPNPNDILAAAIAQDFGRIYKEAFIPGTTAEQILADLTTAYAAIK
jgi:multiple sugar transport system substrate-binding protein